MSDLRAAWPDAHVRGVARDFLIQCGWALEVGDGGGGWLRVPPDAELSVCSAAVILSAHGFGDHIEAIVFLGVERSST